MSLTRASEDRLLTQAIKAYIPEGFIADMILPTVKVRANTGNLGGLTGQHLRILNTVMGGRGMARRVEAIVRDSQTYTILNHGLEGLVTKDDIDNALNPFDAELEESMGLMSLMSLDREKTMSDVLGDTSIITQNVTLSGTAQYNDFTNSDPLGDWITARKTVYDGAGVPPDTAIMSWDVADTLAYHPAILDALGFTQNRAGQLNPAELAKSMGVQRLLIGTPRFNSAQEGQTDALESVWAKNVIFMVAPRVARKYQVSLGYTVRKAGESPRQVFKFNVNNPPKARGIIVTDNYDDLFSDTGAAFLIKDAIA